MQSCGRATFGLDPKADKYRPAWIRRAWPGKDSSDMDLLLDGQSASKTKAVRRIGEEWDATLVCGVDAIPSQAFGHRRIRHKQTVIPLAARRQEAIAEQIEALCEYASNGYSASEMAKDQHAVPGGDGQTWEEADLENQFFPLADVPPELDSEQGRGCANNPTV